jgi:hypothetical protein
LVPLAAVTIQSHGVAESGIQLFHISVVRIHPAAYRRPSHNNQRGRVMIDKIFEYTDGADQITEMGVQYYGATLKVPVGPHAAGEVLTQCILNSTGCDCLLP